MADYKKMYTKLFNAVTDVIQSLDKVAQTSEALKMAQWECEEMMVDESEVIDFPTKGEVELEIPDWISSLVDNNRAINIRIDVDKQTLNEGSLLDLQDIFDEWMTQISDDHRTRNGSDSIRFISKHRAIPEK